MALTFPGESREYRAARARLLEREIELRRLEEAVAKERRALPPGGVVPEDYVFQGDGPVRLSELFGTKTTLAIYSYMFGPDKEEPCMMCTPILDAVNAVAKDIEQRLSLVVVAQSSPARLRTFANARGWNLRLLSAAGTTYNRDYHGVLSEGEWKGYDNTMLNVFRKDGSVVRHFWGSELTHGPRRSRSGPSRGRHVDSGLLGLRSDPGGARRLPHEGLVRIPSALTGG